MISMLEMQLKDALDREQNLKKLNEQIMAAMNGFTKQEKGKDIQILNQMHEQELSKCKATLQEKITILEYELRNKNTQYNQLHFDFKSLQDDLQLMKNCSRCTELQNQIIDITKQHNSEKDSWARESQEAINNLKSINEYDLSLSRMKIKQQQHELDHLNHEKEKLIKQVQDANSNMEINVIQYLQQQRSLLQQVTELHKQQNQLIMSNNQIQLQNAQREQQLSQKICSLEQDNLIYQKQNQELKDQVNRIDQQLKLSQQQFNDKEIKLNEQIQQLSKKWNLEKKNCEQYQTIAQKIKDEYQRKQSIILQDSLNKEQQIKSIQTQLIRQKSKNRYYEVTLSQQNLLDTQIKTPNPAQKHKKQLSSEYTSVQAPQHHKNRSQGNISKISLLPSSIQKSEQDSVLVNDILNSTRNHGDCGQLSARQMIDDHLTHVESFNCSQLNKVNQVPQEELQVLTDRQRSPQTRSILPPNFKVPMPQRMKTASNDHKENQPRYK